MSAFQTNAHLFKHHHETPPSSYSFTATLFQEDCFKFFECFTECRTLYNRCHKCTRPKNIPVKLPVFQASGYSRTERSTFLKPMGSRIDFQQNISAYRHLCKSSDIFCHFPTHRGTVFFFVITGIQ